MFVDGLVILDGIPDHRCRRTTIRGSDGASKRVATDCGVWLSLRDVHRASPHAVLGILEAQCNRPDSVRTLAEQPRLEYLRAPANWRRRLLPRPTQREEGKQARRACR